MQISWHDMLDVLPQAPHPLLAAGPQQYDLSRSCCQPCDTSAGYHKPLTQALGQAMRLYTATITSKYCYYYRTFCRRIGSQEE